MNAVAQLKQVPPPNLGGTMPIAEEVRAEMRSSGLTQREVARQAGIQATMLSSWLNGSYKGDVERVTTDLRIWLDARAARKEGAKSLPASPGYLETPTSRQIVKVLRFAQVAGDICVIGGAPGTGKSSTIAHYADTNPNVWVVTISPDCSGVVPTLEEVAIAIGMRELPGGAARLRREIESRIKRTDGLLVVDEAQHLSTSALEELRTLHDRTSVGLVLAGNRQLFGRLTGGKRAEGFAQLYSRVGKRFEIPAPKPADADVLSDHFGIADKEARTFLRAIADEHGGLRLLVKTVRLAILHAGFKTLDEESLRDAWLDLGGCQ